MKRLPLLLFAIAMTLTTLAQEHLKLMSYNIRNATGIDGITDYQRIADIILREAPDVVAIQEIDSVTIRSKQKYVLGEIATLTQMHSTYAPAIDYQDGKYGIGILSREEPLSVYRYPLPGREEKRVLLMAEFANYIFCCSHFSLTPEDRLASVEIIKQIATQHSHGKPLFLAGDLNDAPHTPEIQALTKDFILLNDTLCPTYRANSPRITIDYITAWRHANNHFERLTTEVLNEPVASDHLPIVVQLRMTKTPYYKRDRQRLFHLGKWRKKSDYSTDDDTRKAPRRKAIKSAKSQGRNTL